MSGTVTARATPLRSRRKNWPRLTRASRFPSRRPSAEPGSSLLLPRDYRHRLKTKLPGQPRPPRKETTNRSISSCAHDGRQPVLLILESIPRQGCRSVSDIRRQADFDVLALPVVFRREGPRPPFGSGFGQIPRALSLLYRANYSTTLPQCQTLFSAFRDTLGCHPEAVHWFPR